MVYHILSWLTYSSSALTVNIVVFEIAVDGNLEAVSVGTLNHHMIPHGFVTFDLFESCESRAWYTGCKAGIVIITTLCYFIALT